MSTCLGLTMWRMLAVTIRYGVTKRKEAYLERRFDDAYRDYKARVLPGCNCQTRA
jgi:protein-S-isoprenylcysteine O-methyltransferase Ste14